MSCLCGNFFYNRYFSFFMDCEANIVTGLMVWYSLIALCIFKDDINTSAVFYFSLLVYSWVFHRFPLVTSVAYSIDYSPHFYLLYFSQSRGGSWQRVCAHSLKILWIIFIVGRDHSIKNFSNQYFYITNLFIYLYICWSRRMAARILCSILLHRVLVMVTSVQVLFVIVKVCFSINI